jgi:rRNA-processing protein FCF1
MHGHKVQNLSSVVIIFSQIIMYFFEFKVNFQSNLKKGKKTDLKVLQHVLPVLEPMHKTSLINQ